MAMNSNYSLFSVIGLEIEYMLVDQDTLNISPKSDLILKKLAGKQVNEVVVGDIGISNELVLHVLELKNDGPKPLSSPIAQQFQQTILHLQPFLDEHNLQLLPTGAHPWMDPLTETKRWPHGNRAIYQQYDSIFNCSGHGWSNLQSMHVNLPFSNDNEFSHLHNTIRLLLPILPAIAASSPFLDGKVTNMLDSRLYFYDKNQQKIPSISGEIIPEFIQSEAEYQDKILSPMYSDISPYDPEKKLQFEWLNSRGAIPKFESKAIEIRILDSQECVNADIAIATAIHAILKSWHKSTEIYLDKPCSTQHLKFLYDRVIKEGFNVVIDDSNVLTQWQLPKRTMNVRDVWSMLIERVSHELDPLSQRTLEYILQQGSLSERILRACNKVYTRNMLTRVYRQLGDCLLTNEVFQSS